MRRFAVAVLGLMGCATLFAQDTTTQEPAKSGRALIDQHVSTKRKDRELAATSRADDSEFLRRVYLDIIGTIPSLEQTEEFLKDSGSDKRSKLVDALLANEKYASYSAQMWAGSLVGFDDSQPQLVMVRASVAATLKPAFENNVGFDQFARQILTAEGEITYGRGQGMKAMMGDDEEAAKEYAKVGLLFFYYETQQTAQRETPQALAGKFARTFLGTQIQCAQCHDHPFDKWTQKDFYGMAGFFSSTMIRREIVGGRDPKKPIRDEEFKLSVNDRQPRRFEGMKIPDSKEPPVQPSFLGAGGGAKAGEELRTAFARLMTSKENLQFARASVNRHWARLMGRGLVNPIDGFDSKNGASHPELLDELAKDFIAHNFDLKWLLKEIALSETYQLTSKSKKREPDMEKYYAVSSVRALSPEQIMASLITAGTVGADAKSVMNVRDLINTFKDFRYAFGDDEGAEKVEFEGTIPAALMMMNSVAVQKATQAAARGSRLQSILGDYKAPQDQVKAMFASALSRLPTSAELTRYSAVAAKGPKGAEDVYWTLLNSSEFLFNK